MIDVASAVLCLSLGLAAQDPPGAPASDPVPAVPAERLYAPPPVRPFEPPSDFGRETPEGDAAARPFRAPIAGAVPVDAYAGEYEAEPTAAEAGYAQGVAGAELSMDALAGPLDGRWSVIDADGRPLLRLVLDDPGPGLAVEGAWRDARGSDRGVAVSGQRSPRLVDLILHGGGALSLSPAGEGWQGVLVGPDGRRRPVRMVR